MLRDQDLSGTSCSHPRALTLLLQQSQGLLSLRRSALAFLGPQNLPGSTEKVKDPLGLSQPRPAVWRRWPLSAPRSHPSPAAVSPSSSLAVPSVPTPHSAWATLAHPSRTLTSSRSSSLIPRLSKSPKPTLPGQEDTETICSGVFSAHSPLPFAM